MRSVPPTPARTRPFVARQRASPTLSRVSSGASFNPRASPRASKTSRPTGNRMYKLSRRQLTLGAGAGILLAPFVSMLREGTTRAGTTKQAKRLLVFCTMGTKPDSWKPTVSGEAISSWSAMTQPLSAIKDNVLLVEGCPAGSPGEGHGSNAGLTGQGNGYFAVNNVVVPAISVDQFVADKLVKNGINRPLASLVLGSD